MITEAFWTGMQLGAGFAGCVAGAFLVLLLLFLTAKLIIRFFELANEEAGKLRDWVSEEKEEECCLFKAMKDMHGHEIEVGRSVTWKSQANGNNKVKRGSVLDIIPKGQFAYEMAPLDLAKSQKKGQDFSSIDRLLVLVVNNDGKEYLYTPRPGQVEIL